MRLWERVGSPERPKIEPGVALGKYEAVARQRVAAMSTDALYDWVDTQVGEVGRSISNLRRTDSATPSANPPEEVMIGVATLYIAAEELVKRVR